MSIWGRRDGEPPAEEAHEGQAETSESQAEAQDTREPAAEHQDGEPAPAFWRTQGERPASLGRDPADAPPPDYGHVPPAGPTASAHGQQASPEAPAPAAGKAPAGTGAPVPVPTGVVIDGETAVKDPGLTGTSGEQARAHDVAAAPAVTEVREPVVTEVREPVVTEVREPVVTEAQEPVVTEAQEPVVTEAHEPAPAAATITPQRWSEILVAFVDDPRGSVKMAADAVDEAIGEFVNSVRARQRVLASSWQGTETGTEQLRTVLRDYRKFWHQVQQLDLGEKTSA